VTAHGRLAVLTVIAWACALGVQPSGQDPVRLNDTAVLESTRHLALPAALSDYWLVPDAAARADAAADPNTVRAVRGISLVNSNDAAGGLALLSEVPEASALSTYAQFYSAVALIALGRLDEAESMLGALADRRPEGALAQAVVIRLADVALERGSANEIDERLVGLADTLPKPSPEVWLKRGLVEEAAGEVPRSVDAFRKVYYTWPASGSAIPARAALSRLDALTLGTPDAFATELARAELLYSGRQWADARPAFAALVTRAEGRDRVLTALRVAECDYYLQKYRPAREGLRPLLKNAEFGAEAKYIDAASVRGLGDRTGYVRLLRDLVEEHPTSIWSAEALNSLATHYITADSDDEADKALRELLKQFPRHRHAERAAWKVGWLAYRQREFADAVVFFERAAAAFPRADNRPAWLYWSARARDELGDAPMALSRYRLVALDYQNSYYGRLASNILRARRDPPVVSTIAGAAAAPATPLPNEALTRQLLAAGLLDDGMREIQYAQEAWGDSPRLQATVAWIRHRQAPELSSTERFTALRGAITMMRRAYPQFMAAGGETLPVDLLRIIFPLDYWPLIVKYASDRELDPFLLAALVAQESTFTAEIRSAANAYGLMQIIPSTGRTVARQLGMKGFSVAMLREPEPNVRIGTQYFKDLLDRFGGAHFALAGYNAGPHRVVRWKEAAPDAPADEFVDNIPFAETQAYVKRILGTADDYRRLYDNGALDPYAGLGAERIARPTTSVLPVPTPAATPKAAAPKAAAPRAAAPTKKATSPSPRSRRARR
jgi:soluble lytic murein transglycosylase